MKFTWEKTDIRPGMTVRSTATNAQNAIFMVGYRRNHDTPGNELLLIDLADGLVVAHSANEELMVTYLNGGYRPYRLQLTEQAYDKFEKVLRE